MEGIQSIIEANKEKAHKFKAGDRVLITMITSDWNGEIGRIRAVDRDYPEMAYGVFIGKSESTVWFQEDELESYEEPVPQTKLWSNPNAEDDGFTKYDSGKPKHSYLPSGILDGVLDVMAFGAKKYAKDNWKKCDNQSSYYDACHRHLESFWGGVDLDEESTLHHIDHALCNLVFLRWMIANKKESDDRSNIRRSEDE